MTNKLTRFARWYLTKQINAISYIGLRKHFLKVNDFEKYFLNRNGLEIGGPSQVFTDKGIFPIYRLLNNLDGCNFTNETVWEGSISEGVYDFYPGKTGRQFICEGSSLVFAGNEQYDFLLSSHSLEHHANVIRTLHEWKRVVRPGGILLIIVPEKKFTFDHKRDYTPFDHFVLDEKDNVGEDDLTHLQEILQLHDLTRDRGVGDRQSFERRSRENYLNRCLHQHVFNFGNLSSVANYLQLEILATKFVRPYHNVIFMRKGES